MSVLEPYFSSKVGIYLYWSNLYSDCAYSKPSLFEGSDEKL